MIKLEFVAREDIVEVKRHGEIPDDRMIAITESYALMMAVAEELEKMGKIHGMTIYDVMRMVHEVRGGISDGVEA